MKSAKRSKNKPAADQTGVLECAETVEEFLEKEGIKLTIGGEPTFVPRNPDGREWSVDALGPTKLGYARRFAAEMVRRYLPGAAILETSGKHYPGEPIPRWCLQIQWLTDEAEPPLWKNRALLGPRDKPAKLAEAREFAEALAGALKFKRNLVSAREPGVPAGDADRGYVLPLDNDEGRWISGKWKVRGKQVTLLPGTSWIGLRLPMSELPEGALRRALTVESHADGLAVFIPPLFYDPYVKLVRTIEAVAEKLGGVKVILAGYAPPVGKEFRSLGLGSDPGVLEANLPACDTWAEYQAWVVKLYHAGKSVGLCGRKYQFNGQMAGTGGGAHLCFGGPEPENSPFFERPEFLPSILRYWQHHPALSYAFSGQFIGPGCQAPRADECLPDFLNEMELACRGAEKIGRPCDKFMFNLLFRDLLTDRGGNTHRAEISVDKLWNPAQSNGKIGIIEFRAFESYPNPEWVGAVALFVRAIMVRLLRDPYRKPFKDMSARLADEFYLPSVLWTDICSIAADLRRSGIPFDEAWLRPVWEFRFPVLGTLPTPHGDIVLRQALEAWPILSEQAEGGATSRSVDSSLDRVEVALPAGFSPAKSKSAVPPDRLLVNGHSVPFKKVGGAFVAGVRYRAFYLVPALHPHISVHTPLRFEWVEGVSGKVKAAVRWHSWRPKGTNYKSRPATPAQARRRLTERWVRDRKAVGKARVVEDAAGKSSRLTLDLRMFDSESDSAS